MSLAGSRPGTAPHELRGTVMSNRPRCRWVYLAERGEEFIACCLTAPARFGADPAVLVHAGVLFAFVGAVQIRADALNQFSDHVLAQAGVRARSTGL